MNISVNYKWNVLLIYIIYLKLPFFIQIIQTFYIFTYCSSIICSRKTFELFLTCSIPYLTFYWLSINIYNFRAKFNSNSNFMPRSKAKALKLWWKTRLSYSWFSNHNKFKGIIRLLLMIHYIIIYIYLW
jgi:hypothetical protein